MTDEPYQDTTVQDIQMAEKATGKSMFSKRFQQIATTESPYAVETPVELMRELLNPSKLKQSAPHDLAVNDAALSNLPSTEYAELMAKYMETAAIFEQLGYPQITKLIHAEMVYKAWALMGTHGWLRDKMNEARATITKQEHKPDEKGGIKFPSLR